jgi:hypothetical protein
MKTLPVEIEEKIDHLLAVLDNDILHMEETLSRLNELRAFVIKRDDVSLRKLLESVQAEANNYRDNELKRRMLREELAIAFGCSMEQLTLSRLETELSGDKKDEVARRKIKVRALAGHLKKEHLNTAILLSDCARFSRMLLKNVFELGGTGVMTYGPRGYAEHQTNKAFVNLQF